MVDLFKSQIVHVVSKDAVPNIESFTLFQSKDVNGPQYLLFLFINGGNSFKVESFSLKLNKWIQSDDDANKEVKDMASKYNMKEDEFLNAFGGLDMMKYDMKMRKAIEVLKGE